MADFCFFSLTIHLDQAKYTMDRFQIICELQKKKINHDSCSK